MEFFQTMIAYSVIFFLKAAMVLGLLFAALIATAINMGATNWLSEKRSPKHIHIFALTLYPIIGSVIGLCVCISGTIILGIKLAYYPDPSVGGIIYDIAILILSACFNFAAGGMLLDYELKALAKQDSQIINMTKWTLGFGHALSGVIQALFCLKFFEFNWKVILFSSMILIGNLALAFFETRHFKGD